MNAHGPKSMLSPEIVMLSVFITPWTNPTSIHRATSDACASTTRSNSARYGFGGVGGVRVVPSDRVVGQAADQRRVVVHRRVLERADPEMARGHPHEHRAREQSRRARPARPSRRPPAPGSWGCRARAAPRRSRTRAASGRRRPCRRRPGRTACGPEPFRCRSRRRPSASTHLAEQQGAPVAEPGREPAELVARRRPARPAWRRRCRRPPRSTVIPAGDRSASGSTPSSTPRDRR